MGHAAGGEEVKALLLGGFGDGRPEDERMMTRFSLNREEGTYVGRCRSLGKAGKVKKEGCVGNSEKRR